MACESDISEPKAMVDRTMRRVFLKMPVRHMASADALPICTQNCKHKKKAKSLVIFLCKNRGFVFGGGRVLVFIKPYRGRGSKPLTRNTLVAFRMKARRALKTNIGQPTLAKSRQESRGTSSDDARIKFSTAQVGAQ